MKIKLIRYSKIGNNRRKEDKAAENVEWNIIINKNGNISIKTETDQVYICKVS